jgi:hypothetical protein
VTNELLGVRVELAAPGFHVRKPLIDRPLPGGLGHLAADRSRAILSVVGVGTFAVEDGCRIRFQPDADLPTGALSAWLHGTVMALLLAQRGQFALHASVVKVAGKGIAVAGFQRAGKSTTALRLGQRGHSFVTDDVSPVVTGDPVVVHPSTRPVHVHPASATTLGLDVSDARPVATDHSKVALALASHDPVPLGTIAVLEVSDPNVPVEAVRARGARAHWLICQHTYRVGLLRELWQVEMFVWAGEIADRVPVYLVTRPSGRWSVDAVAEAVEHVALTGTRTEP